jgi:hypothetical protein
VDVDEHDEPLHHSGEFALDVAHQECFALIFLHYYCFYDKVLLYFRLPLLNATSA